MPDKKYRFLLDTSLSWKAAFPKTISKAVLHSLEDFSLPLNASDYRILCTANKKGHLVLTAETGSGFGPKSVLKPDFRNTGVVQVPQSYDQKEQDDAIFSLVSNVPFEDLFYAVTTITLDSAKITGVGNTKRVPLRTRRR